MVSPRGAKGWLWGGERGGTSGLGSAGLTMAAAKIHLENLTIIFKKTQISASHTGIWNTRDLCSQPKNKEHMRNVYNRYLTLTALVSASQIGLSKTCLRCTKAAIQ